MRQMTKVFRKELWAYLVSPIPYVVIAIFAAFIGWWFFYQGKFFLHKQASLQPLFDIMPWTMIFLVPAITMRLWSEEARGGTLETLFTMPVRPWALVVGKFLGAWVLLGACLATTLPILVTVVLLGDVDGGPIWTGYLGAWLMGGALTALGLWISALTRHQIVAFLVTMIVSLVLVLLRFMAMDAGPAVGAVFENISVASRYSALGRGVVDLRDVLYFVSFGALFLYLNAETVENRRYR